MAKALNVSLQVSADTGQAKQALQSLQQQLTQLMTTPANITIGGNIKEGALEASKAIAQLQATLKSSTNSLTGNLNLTKFNQEMIQSGMSLQKYQTQLQAMGPAGQKAFAQLASSIAQAEVPLRRTSGLFTELWTTMKNTARWQISSSILHGFMGAIQGAYQYAQDLNKSLTDIQIVTQASDEHMAQFAKTANTAAKELSTTTNSYAKASLIYYQQGLGDKEVKERTDATIKMANVTGQTAQQVSDQMTAIWNNFDNGSHSLEYYADVITALGAATASSSEEISKGLQKFAAVADTVGLSYENATAALATITATTRQSADTVGTGLRTLFSRLQSLKLGETLEDGVDLTKYSKALKTIGVDVLDATGNLRDMDDILEDMGAKWQDLTDAQKTALAQTVGGVRQYTTLMALMENFDFYKQNLQIAKNSEGTLQKQQAIYEKSWQAASKRVRASAESIYSDLLDDKFFIKLTDGFSKFLNLIHNTIQSLGGLKGVLLGIGTLMTTVFANKTAQKLQNIIYDLKMLTPKGKTEVYNLQKQGVAMLASSLTSQGGVVGDAMSGAYQQQGILQQTYLMNADKMGETERSIAASLMQQQAAMISNVQLSAEAAENAQNEATSREQVARAALNTFKANGSPTQNFKDIAKIADAGQLFSNLQTSLNKIKFPEALDASTIANYRAELKQMGVDFAQIEKVFGSGSTLSQNFKILFNTKDIDEFRAAFDSLITAGPMEAMETQINDIVNRATQGMDLTEEELETLRSKLYDVFSANMNLAGANDNLSSSEANLSAFTKQLAQAMEELAQRNYTTMQSFMAVAGMMSSVAMVITSIKNLSKTWSDDNLSGGDKLLATFTTLGPSLMMLSRVDLKGLVSAGQKLSATFPALGAAGAKLGTGLASLGGGAASAEAGLAGTEAAAAGAAGALGTLAIAIAIVAAAALAIYSIADWIETDNEKAERLKQETIDAENSAVAAKDAYDNLLSGFASHNQLLEQIEELTAGTLEFRKALLDANEEAIRLIETYHLKSSDWYKDEHGVIRFNEGVQERVTEERLADMERAEKLVEAAKYAEKQQSAKSIMNRVGSAHSRYLQDKKSHDDKKGQVGTGVYGEYMSEDQWRTQHGYNDVARYLGYQNHREMFADYNNNYANFAGTVGAKTGATEAYAQALDTISRDSKGQISDEQALINSYLVNHYNPNDMDLQYDEAVNHWWTRLSTLENTYKQQLIEQYGEEEGLRKFNDLIGSESYGNLTRNGRADQLVSLINNERQLKALEDKAGEMRSEDLINTAQRYKDYSKKTGEEIVAMRTANAVERQRTDLTEEEARLQEIDNELNDEMWSQYEKNLGNYTSLATSLFSPSELTNEDFFKNAGLKLSNEDRDKINTVTTEFVNTYGKNSGRVILKNLTEAIEQGDTILENALSNITLSGNPIEDLFNINNMRGLREDVRKELFDNLKKDVGGDAGILESLFNSESFQDNLKDLQKEFKKTGKISASSIYAMAESSDELAQALEIVDANAQGVADALEMVESGKVQNLTNALIAACSAAGELENNLAKTYNYIDTFQEERSVQDIGSFYKKRADAVQAGFDSGMLLDAPLLQSMEALFGSELRSKYQKDIYKWTGDQNLTPEEISDLVNDNYAAEIAAMQSIQERGNLSGMFEYYDNKGTLDMFDYDAKTGQVVAKDLDSDIFKERGWADQNKFIADLQESYGMSEDMARAMASEYAATNGTIAKTWRETAAQNGIDKLLDTGNGEVLTGDQLRAFYDQYADVIDSIYGYKPGEGKAKFLEDMAAQAETTGKAFVDLGENFSFAENSYEDFADAYNKSRSRTTGRDSNYHLEHDLQQSGAVRAYTDSNGDTIDHVIDIDKAKDFFMAQGASAEEAYGYIDQMREAYGETDKYASQMSKSITLADGSVRQLTSSTTAASLEMMGLGENAQTFDEYCQSNGLEGTAADFDAWTASIQNSQDALAAAQQQTDILAKAFVQSFANLGDQGIQTTLNITEGNGVEATRSFLNEAQEPKTISITISAPGLAEAATQAAGLNSKNVTYGITVSVSGDVVEAKALGLLASGYNNAKGFAGGKHSNGQYEGLAEVGELGPELFIHDGQPYLAGVHGRTRAYVHKNDEIYTAVETQQILEENPSMQEIPGFSVGYNRVTWGRKGTGANAGNAKTSKYEPERYHLITRQLKDLQREYDRLDKIKENCYGTNKLEAIQREIDATNELIKGQKELVKEAEDYLKIDAGRLRELLGAGEFQIDENGNLLNFEELQEKYRKKAEEDKDEHAQDVWKALQQYEETLDKLQEANVEMQDLLYQEMELRLEKITTKVDMRIDFDEREIKLLDHYIKRIDDNIYHTAEVLALTEEKLGHISKKIDDTTEGIHELFAEMSDSEGNLITKADGTAYTLDEWLALTNAERDMLDINGQFGEQLEEYMDDLLDYIEELEEFKTKGVEEFADAFSELNDNVRSSIDLFDHYNQLLSSLKNITDLQGIKLTAELKAARKEIDQIMFQNTQNNIQAEGENYKRLVSEVEDLRRKIANTQDETLKKAWEEQLKVAEEELRTSEQNMLSLWETGLQQAKDMFEQALQDAVDTYETTIAGMYGTVDELEKAWDQQKKNDEFYVKDFEKYYQIQKLQRSITKDLDAAARAGNKQNQGLKKLYDDLNAAREDGVELSAYDLDIYAKRYEYEKALMELEDARNNKNEVRLQRDANGNWGYVYTSAADEDDLIAKQQAVDDKFYELQKATQERIASLSDDMMSEITGVGKRLQELHSSGASQDTIKKYLEQEKLYLENYEKGLAKALEDAGMTEEEARNRYGNAGFDILNDFQETLFSAITGGDEGLDKFFKRVSDAITTADGGMVQAGSEYQKQVSAIDKWFNESGEDLATVIKGFATLIGEESSGTLLDSEEQIANAKQTFADILSVARDFEQEFMTIYQPIIDANEQLVADLLEALHALNEEEYEGPDHSSNPDTNIGDIIGDTGSSSDGGSGSGSSGGGSGNDKVFSKYSDWETNDNKHWRYAIYTDGSKYKTDEGYHQWVKDAGDHWEDDKHYNSRTCQICKKRKWWYSYRGEGGTGGGCFEAGTQIIMADNSIKNIEDIKVNDYVYAYNEQTGIFEIHQVIKSYVHHNTPRVISVIFSNGLVLNMTPGHPILTTEGWKSRDIENSLIEHNTIATWLNIGDTIINISNDIIQIIDIQEKNIPDNFDTYNIEVETCHTFLVNGLVVHNAKSAVMERMATGGYTGEWGPEGRMAILDEKELVLNKDDTKNFLDATTILRTLDLQTGLFSKGLGSIITPLIANMQQGTLDQNVHIDATFPNVTDHSEIEAAFDNLINKASQYANRKNMSSMTFNDMYISKF